MPDLLRLDGELVPCLALAVPEAFHGPLPSGVQRKLCGERRAREAGHGTSPRAFPLGAGVGRGNRLVPRFPVLVMVIKKTLVGADYPFPMGVDRVFT